MQYGTGLCLPRCRPGTAPRRPGGFHDAGGLAYEFFRVYSGVEGTGDRGAFVELDEDLSYWAVSWPVPGGAANEDEHIVWRWLNYERARSLTGTNLRFQRFSSPLAMREEIPRLLQLPRGGGSR